MPVAEPLQPFAYIVVGALALFLFFQLGNAFGRRRGRQRQTREQSFEVPILPELLRSSAARESRWNLLTAREKQVAGLAARGFSNSEIAARLRIKARTVDSHLKNIYFKLNVHTRTELAFEFRDLVENVQ